ncbi:MAG: hypothetical protein FVQ84_08445 [Planctomycetes bacterium]|nr:hypothetical protein [Planctomycetota bacterium]
MKSIGKIFKSKKFIVTIIGLIIPILNSNFDWGLDKEAIFAMLGSVGLFNIGQGIADAGSKGATSGTVD